MAQASDIVNSNWSPGQEMPGKEPSVKMRTPLISEVLKKVNNAKTKPQKIKILREYDSPALRSLCKWSFDPNIETALPEGSPPFIPNEAPEGRGPPHGGGGGGAPHGAPGCQGPPGAGGGCGRPQPGRPTATLALGTLLSWIFAQKSTRIPPGTTSSM